MAKVELLKAARGKAKGEVVEVPDRTAKLLKAIGKAKDYVAPVIRPTRKTETKVVEPETKPEEPTTETTGESGFSFRRYSRRDMTPENE